MSVDRLSSSTIDAEVKRKQQASSRPQRRHHRSKYRIPLLDTERPFASQGHIVYDPPGNGNCQFAALCHLLAKIGIFRSFRTLREQVVSYLVEHPYTPDGFPLELYTGEEWDTYISGMLDDGTYGDHITLQAVSDMFNINIIVHSSLGIDATVTIVPTHSVAIDTLNLGHFAEEEGEHYVALQLHETQDVQQLHEDQLPVVTEATDAKTRSCKQQ
ncbi:OVARIAN TUMOR DOMAIN-containing deubiquitinating enzyme 10-like [Haliotis rubra]|uniref:OVARIAN TUMOR DOMAIN-containing deubiquitinating enzyme 10-like n=1 Tax=Haliotis rubra TaxID=36100 RepID=UPI001EE52185|nr:OVARIAN TUMOR DOMAIN-containing deubiquitinating enzyme 10-like [Haliotis rubra]